MKNNLFLIHTPMQLFVAQQLIYQEKLQNNILVYGYVPGNEHFIDIYKLMLISSMWKETIPRTIKVGWAMVDFRHIISSTKEVKKNFRVIESFIKRKEIGSLYLGDISNRGHQLLAKIFKGQIKIVFFEEGSSHYIKHQLMPPRNFAEKTKRYVLTFLLDNLLFRPMCGFKYTKEFYFDFIDRNEIPMDERYSILPYYQQPYDKRLRINKLLSPNLEKYLLSEIGSFSECEDDHEKYLFLSSPIYEITSKRDIPLICDVVNDFANTIKGKSILVKFHPREKEEVKQMILEKFDANDVHYIVLSNEKNIPVEYYLQIIQFTIIFAFASSALLYNGYVYPETPIVRLDKLYMEKCREKGIRELPMIEKFCSNFDRIMTSLRENGK